MDEKQFCGRCGALFSIFENVGQLKCNQLYFVCGKKFKIPSDHLAVDSTETDEPRVMTKTEMKKQWQDWIYDENDFIILTDRKMKKLPKIRKECMIKQKDSYLSKIRKSKKRKRGKDSNEDKTDIIFTNLITSNEKSGADSTVERNIIEKREKTRRGNKRVIGHTKVYRIDIRKHLDLRNRVFPDLIERHERESNKKPPILFHFLEVPDFKENYQYYISKVHDLDLNDPKTVEYLKTKKKYYHDLCDDFNKRKMK